VKTGSANCCDSSWIWSIVPWQYRLAQHVKTSSANNFDSSWVWGIVPWQYRLVQHLKTSSANHCDSSWVWGIVPWQYRLAQHVKTSSANLRQQLNLKHCPMAIQASTARENWLSELLWQQQLTKIIPVHEVITHGQQTFRQDKRFHRTCETIHSREKGRTGYDAVDSVSWAWLSWRWFGFECGGLDQGAICWTVQSWAGAEMKFIGPVWNWSGSIDPVRLGHSSCFLYLAGSSYVGFALAWCSSLCNFLHSPVTSSLFDPNILLRTMLCAVVIHVVSLT
jgi:hypothetical protein